MSLCSRRRPVFIVLSLIAVLCAACSNQGPTQDQILFRANEALAAGQYDRAEKAYREVLRLRPGLAEAERPLGVIYLEQGQPIQAYPLLLRAAERLPQDLDLQLKLGQAALALGQLSQARDLAQQILDQRPGDDAALLLLVDTARAPEQIKETQALIESMRAQDQGRASYHVALGLLELRQRDAGRAEGEFKAALALDPKSSGGHSGLGHVFWLRNQLDAADEAMKRAADLSPLRSPMRMRYVDFKLRTGNVAEAKAILESINKQIPDYLPARVYLMKLACAERRDDDCAARVQSVLAQDPINFDAILQDSIINLTKGNVDTAVAQLEHLNKTFRDRPQLLHQLAVAYLAQAGRTDPVRARDAFDKAANRLADAIRLDPRFAEAILLYAELQIRSGNAAVVINALVQLLKEQPQIANAHYLLAGAYRAVQRDDEALAVLRNMASLFLNDPQPPFSAGTILLAQGRAGQARSEFMTSVAISPDYLPAMEAIINLDLSEKQHAAAMERVQNQIDKSPNLGQLWGLRAKVLLAQGEAERAEADLLKAIELDPKLEPAYLLLAELYASSNRQAQAIETLKGFLSTRETIPALLQLASMQERVKDFAAARDSYERVLVLSADNVPALNNLAVLYSEHLGQLDVAHDRARRARELAPKDSNVADTLGWILFKRRDYRNALSLLMESVAQSPDAPERQFHFGMAHYMLGEEAPARVALQRAVGARSDFPEKEEARQRLALLAIDAGTASADARAELDRFLKGWPNDPAALMRFAQLQIRDGAADRAIKTLETIVANNLSYGQALRELALLYGGRSIDDPNAYELVQRARQTFPDDPDVAKVLGIFTYRRELYGRSAELLDQAARKRPDDAQLLYYLGAAHGQLKHWTACRNVLERALSLKPPSEVVDRAKRALVGCSEAEVP